VAMFTNGAPVQDDGERLPRNRPYHAGGPQGNIADRKNALLNTGAGAAGLMGRAKQNGHVYEAPLKPQPTGPVPGSDDLEYGPPQPRPHPGEIEVQRQLTHAGTLTRYLDGHSEIHRDRPRLVEMLKDPDLSHVHHDIRDEITARDVLHTHRYW
jgi:hypothetical protein